MLKKGILLASVLIIIITIGYLIPGEERDRLSEMMRPSDALELRYAYPNKVINFKQAKAQLTRAKAQDLKIRNQNRSAQSWTIEGPYNIDGRVNSITIDPSNAQIVYAGICKGGAFKTIDGGQNWHPIFDDQEKLPVSSIEIHPQNHDILYLGTGDKNIGGTFAVGDGIYKSYDAGVTWEKSGLDSVGIISDIIIHPDSPDIVYCAAMGKPFEKNTHRGLYKSIDGGTTWENILFVSDSSGIIDFVMHPSHPDTLFATSWNRIRSNSFNSVQGPDAFVHRSFDGGATWEKLSNGLPGSHHSRIGLDITQEANPSLYILYCDNESYNFAGLYESSDLGESFTRVDNGGELSNLHNGFGWYFGEIKVNPFDPTEIYALGVDMYVSHDSGNSWDMTTPPWYTSEVHADKHDLKFISENLILLATDGGLFQSIDGGETWTDYSSMPITQFYHIGIDPYNSREYYGGAQDNGTLTGNAKRAYNWEEIWGGDGFQPLFDPVDSNIMYCQTQNGNLYYIERDWGSGNYFTDGIDYSDRVPWDMPFSIQEINGNSTTYCGTHRVYTMNGAPYGTWRAISDDLCKAFDQDDPSEGRFHMISSVRPNPINKALVYVGTSDGKVWKGNILTEDWEDITQDLPNRFVTKVEPSPNNDSIIYTCHSGYRDGDYISYLHRSKDGGNTWESISNNLPAYPANDICIAEHHEDSILYVATDGGVYRSLNAGEYWERLGNNLPTVKVYDIEIDTALNKLVAGTFARSIWSIEIPELDTTRITVAIADHTLENDLTLYPNPTSDYLQFDQWDKWTSYFIYNTHGQIVQSASMENQITIQELNNGLYWLEIKNAEGQSIVKRFQKQ